MEKNKIKNLSRRLKNKEIIIIDGATGTEIQRRGVKTTLPLWSAKALLTNPNVIKDIHKDYILNGADIIITNTFRTTVHTLKKANLENKATQITILACKLIKEAIKEAGVEKEIYIAGSMAPLEDCYSPELTPQKNELEREYLSLAKNLKKGGADFLLLETMITIKETLAAIKAVKKVKMSFAVSFCCNEKNQLLGGESIKLVIRKIEKYNPLFIGVNCIQPELATQLIKTITKITDLPLCVYANGYGKPDDDQGWLFSGKKEINKFLNEAKKWVKSGVQLIGGCCGTTPEYIKTICLTQK